jgi:hypothetical protein
MEDWLRSDKQYRVILSPREKNLVPQAPPPHAAELFRASE